MIWDIEKIDIYSEMAKQKILNFDNNKKAILHMVKNDEIYDLLEKDLKRTLFIKNLFKE